MKENQVSQGLTEFKLHKEKSLLMLLEKFKWSDGGHSPARELWLLSQVERLQETEGSDSIEKQLPSQIPAGLERFLLRREPNSSIYKLSSIIKFL